MGTLKISLLLFFVHLAGGCASTREKPVVIAAKASSEKSWEERMLEAKRQGPAAEEYLGTELFLKGNAALMEGDYHTGADLLRHLVRLTDEAFVHKKFAVALIRLGEMDEAKAVLEKLYARKDVKDESIGLILAGVYGALERPEDARKMYRAILAANPKQEDACLFLGKMMIHDKQWKDAESWLKSCQAKHPKEGVFAYQLGKLFVEKGDFKSAIKAFEDSYRRDPESTQATAALGVIHEQQEHPEKAVVVYERHLKRRPQDTVILNRIVQTLFTMERFKEVVGYAEALVDQEPDNLNMRVKLGILYTDAREFEKAISVFHELLQLAPQSDKILYYLGAIHQEMRRYEQAIEYFAQIPDSSGLFQDSNFQVASMLSTLAQVEHSDGVEQGPQAERFLAHAKRKLIEIPALKVELSVLLAGHYESREQDSEAIAALQQVSAHKDFSVQHKYYLANLLEKTKRYQESTDLITALIESDPKNAHAWNFLGYSLLERGVSPEEAFPYIQKAITLAPQDGYIRDSLGWYYFKTGQTTQALRELSKAYETAPDDMVIAKHLVVIHHALKDFRKARSFLSQALKNARLASERRDLNELQRALEAAERRPASEE